MKKISTYCILLLLTVLFACKEPLPVEVINNQEESVEIESLTPEESIPGNFVSFDSTGILQTDINTANVLYINGIKTSYHGQTAYQKYYQAAFFDKSRPITDSTGKVVSYRLRRLKSVHFGGERAREYRNWIRLASHSSNVDSNGFKYALYEGSLTGTVNYPYDSFLNISLETYLGKDFNFEVPTAPDITGSVTPLGKKSDRNFGIRIEWDGKQSDNDKIDIVISGILLSGNSRIPLLKLRTRDDGRLIIPKEVLRQLRPESFDQFVFSMIRRKTDVVRSEGRFGVSEFLSVSQSIHNIRVDVP